MIVIPCSIAPSRIHGTGVFASSFVAKGAVIWKFDPRFDIVISPEAFDALPEGVRDDVENYSYRPDAKGPYIFESTLGRYMNHSPRPNVDYSQHDLGIAMCDIPAGEELTCDYRQILGDWQHLDHVAKDGRAE